MFFRNFGFTVPRCSAVLSRPDISPVVTPLTLTIAGYSAMAHGVV